MPDGFWSADVESTSQSAFHGGRPFQIGACHTSGKRLSWTWAVDPFTRSVSPPKEDIDELCEFFDHPGRRFVFHNSKFDIRMLSSIGIPVDWERVDDTHIMSHVVHSSGPHSLKDNSIRHLGVDTDDLEELKSAVTEARRIAKNLGWAVASEESLPYCGKPKEGWWVFDMWLPYMIALTQNYPQDHKWFSLCKRYNLQDTERTIALHSVFGNEIEERKLSSQYQERLYALRSTYRMETRGVSASMDLINQAKLDYGLKAETAEGTCLQLAGEDLENIRSGQQIQKVLYDKFQLTPIKYTKQGISTDADTLQAYLDEHLRPNTAPYIFILRLLQSRRYSKAIDYLDDYLSKGIPTTPGWLRIHPSFNVPGTDTTRQSSSNPNAQNISKGGKSGAKDLNLRRAFGPYPGRVWFSIDYSNIELRIFAYASGDQELIQAFETGYSVHLIFAKLLWPTEFERCLKDGVSFKDRYEGTLYQWTKNGNFSLIYGAGVTKANNTYRHKNAYNLIRERMPLIDQFMRAKQQEALEYGYVTCLGGYRLEVPSDGPHKAVNYFVQGSAGWALTMSMNRVDRYLQTLPDYHAIMAVHDELDFDFPIESQNDQIISNVGHLMMSSGKTLGLPLPVEVERHSQTWAVGEKMKLLPPTIAL